MHKYWVIKGYDQSVTCLADDLQNLETRSSTFLTPGILSQTKNNIHKHSTKCTGRTQIRKSNQKAQLQDSGLQKESNQTEQRNSDYERNQIRLLIWLKVKFYSTKILFKLVKQKEGFETKIQALVSAHLDKRAKSYTRSKIRANIAIENNRGKTLEKEKLTNRLTNERSLSVTNG